MKLPFAWWTFHFIVWNVSYPKPSCDIPRLSPWTSPGVRSSWPISVSHFRSQKVEILHWNNFTSQTSRNLMFMFKYIKLDALIKQHKCNGGWWWCEFCCLYVIVFFVFFLVWSDEYPKRLELSEVIAVYSTWGYEKLGKRRRIKFWKSQNQHWLLQEPKQSESKDEMYT